jgi:serpin B
MMSSCVYPVRPRPALFGGLLGAALCALACGDSAILPEPRQLDLTSADVQLAARSNARVSFALHGALRQQPGNLFYSPLGIEAVLGMLYAGAGGETAAQLGALLEAGSDPHGFHHGLGALLADLGGDYPGRAYTLSMANRLYGRLDLEPSPEFLAITGEDYRAPLETTDFTKPEAARSAINRWVASQTRDHVPELLTKGQITDRTLLALVNAIYFKASWAEGFDPANTRSAPFERADHTTVTVQMMSRQEMQVRTRSVAGGQLVELPFRSGDLSFLGLLPDSADGLPALEARLDTLILPQLDELTESEISVELPRFTVKARLDLIPVLKELGIRDLFNAGVCDLSQIDPSRASFVDPFVHEAWMKIDEVGAEAAAATVAVVRRKSAPQTITFDRPFLFMIRDSYSGALLFIGRVSDPSAL